MLKHVAPLTVLAGAALVVAPQAASAGFLDQLFGMAPAPSPYYAPAVPDYDFTAPARPRRHKRVVESKPQKQQPTDLMHDATLQNGDAVMTKQGLRVFVGDGGSHHDQEDFAKVNDISGMPKQEGRQLAELDLGSAKTIDGSTPALQSGRSVSTAVPLTKGYRITDARGRSVRYVGP